MEAKNGKWRTEGIRCLRDMATSRVLNRKGRRAVISRVYTWPQEYALLINVFSQQWYHLKERASLWTPKTLPLGLNIFMPLGLNKFRIT